MSRDNWCKNYNGAFNEACSAGVNYRKAFTGCFFGDRPCQNRESTILCEFVNYRTPEEIEAERIEAGQLFGFIVTGLKTIATQSGQTGSIDCPKCGGNLNWSRASNAHVHATCQTEGCLRWMQ
jgi:hypothetical protein